MEEEKLDTSPDVVDSDGAWYLAGKAARVASHNNKRVVQPDYLRSLVRLGVLEKKLLGPRTALYSKPQIDALVVEERGRKAGRAARSRAVNKDAA